MKYNSLGTSGLSVSEISFGCMSLQGEEAQNIRLLQRALEGGINFFDTADLYDKGKNEELVGKAFQGKRDQVLIATKVGNQWRPDGSGWDWNPTKEYILRAVEGSLRRLKTDYLDLYQLHGGTIEDPIDETIEAFELLKEQGKIKAYGISSIRPNVIKAYVQRSSLASVMMQYSLLDRRPEEEILDLLQQHQVGVLARGSLAQGLLAGKPAKSYLGLSEAEVALAAEKMKAVANDINSPVELAARYVLHSPAITTAVLGIRTEQQLEEALKVAATPRFISDQYLSLKEKTKQNYYEQHRI